MRYEVKIGLLALTAIILAVWGYKYIQGTNLFTTANSYHTYYTNVAGLTVGTPVQISGVTVGSVSGIDLDQQTRTVRVTMTVRKGVNVPVDTRAYITTVSLLGEKAIDLEYEKPCFGNGDCAESGAEITSGTKGILASLMGGGDGENPLDGIKGQLNGALDSLEYMLFDKNSDNPIARSTNDLAVTMENLKMATARLQSIMDANAGEINNTFDNLETITGTLADKQASIASIIDNANELTGRLSRIELDQTMAEVNSAIQSLKGTLNQANDALGGVNKLMNNIESGQGTLGKLLNDDAIYDRLNSATLAADTLFNDFQERPYRYVPFKSRNRVLKFDRKDAALEDQPD